MWPCEVLWGGVAADAGPGAEGLEAERLGLRAADDVPQVDAQVVAEDGHLVDEGDVDVPEVGLQELHGLRFPGSTRAYHLVGEPAVEGGGRLGAGGGEAADDLRGVGGREVAVAGVDAAGGVGEVEVAARLQSGALLEEGAQEFLRRARLHGRLQDHRGVRAQAGGQGAGGGLHLAEVEGAVGAARGGGADDGGTYAAELGGVGGRPEAPGEHPAQFGGRQGTGLRAGLVPEGGDAGGDGGLGQRQAEMSESDDGEICGHAWAVLPSSRSGTGAQALWTERASAMSD